MGFRGGSDGGGGVYGCSLSRRPALGMRWTAIRSYRIFVALGLFLESILSLLSHRFDAFLVIIAHSMVV